MLRLAIGSTAFSKASALCLQGLSLPLVYNALGQHQYELYLLLSALLASIALAQLGAGPGLTQGIAKANAEGRREAEASLFSAALRIAVLSAIVGGSIIISIIHIFPAKFLFGPVFTHSKSIILAISDVCIFVLMAQIISGVVDSALAGYQEQVYTNIGAIFANIVSILGLFYVCKFKPDITSVIFVLYGVPTLSRIVNFTMLCSRRNYLIKSIWKPCREFYGVLMNVGLAFWVIQVSGVVELQGGIYILAHVGTTHATDTFSMVFRCVALAGSVVGIVTQPLWPAFADAVAHRDLSWIYRSFTRIRQLMTIYSLVIALTMGIGGTWIFKHILHINMSGAGPLFWLLGLYQIANIWTHLLYITMMGMPGIWRVATIVVCERALVVLFGVVLSPHFGAPGMAIAYLLASVVLPVWMLPKLMKFELSKIAKSHSLSPAVA